LARENVIEGILKKIPRPNRDELPTLYEDLDEMVRKIGLILINSRLYEPETTMIRFDRANEEDILELIKENPDLMIPFFVMVCGFSVRELERLYGIRNVYSIRKGEQLYKFSKVVKDNLLMPLYLETLIYKFYKNWEEHQKRHYRGREAEEYVIRILRQNGYNAGKIRVICKSKEMEIDCAIPPNNNFKVAIMIREGVFRDLLKRAKEYSTEYDDLLECFPGIKFVLIYFVSPHERRRLDDIKKRIESERQGKKPYDLVILTKEEVKDVLLKKLKEWNI